ncbi:hypothetical protein [Streptomyces sp. NPDC048636]|uniref:hypothetical protein n=1 Tax=Streptomyces sp. NPDC048636 TaxID=3155762 RepID=UPI00343551B7
MPVWTFLGPNRVSAGHVGRNPGDLFSSTLALLCGVGRTPGSSRCRGVLIYVKTTALVKSRLVTGW